MGKKKKKKCAICLEHDHVTCECAFICEDCPMGDACKKFCIFDLCTKFHKIIKRFHKASSYERMERAFEKLDDFEVLLEDAYEYHKVHKGRRCRSCSSKKKVKMLEKACEKLRYRYEDKFESDSDDDYCFIYPTVMPMIGVKEVYEGVSQESHQEALDTPSRTLELAHGVVENDDHYLHEKHLCDEDDVVENFFHCLNDDVIDVDDVKHIDVMHDINGCDDDDHFD